MKRTGLLDRIAVCVFLAVAPPSFACICGNIVNVTCPSCTANPAESCVCDGGICSFDLEITCLKGPFAVDQDDNGPTVCVDDIMQAKCSRIRECQPSVFGMPCGATNWCVYTNTSYYYSNRLIVVEDECLFFP
ncbi:hypothetical protein RAS1_15940 [Phycisphaerae bacterium RAS1]|nr:hypothetical protein RAS1_15940 [Phycisphaerae bacterium RAS1]